MVVDVNVGRHAVVVVVVARIGDVAAAKAYAMSALVVKLASNFGIDDWGTRTRLWRQLRKGQDRAKWVGWRAFLAPTWGLSCRTRQSARSGSRATV